MRPDTYLSEHKQPLMPRAFLEKYKDRTELQMRCCYKAVKLEKSNLENCDFLRNQCYREYDELDHRRFILFAQPQMGKTGVIIEFLHQLHETVNGIKPDEEVEVEDPCPVTVCHPCMFTLPYSRYFEGSLSEKGLRRRYQTLRRGKYHLKMALCRKSILHNSRATEQSLEEEIAKQEGIESETGRCLLRAAIEKYKKQDNQFTIVK